MDTYEKLQVIIIDKLGISKEEISPDKTFTDLSADSLDKVELMMEIEREFNLSIPDEEMEKISTVQDAITLIETKLSTQK